MINFVIQLIVKMMIFVLQVIAKQGMKVFCVHHVQKGMREIILYLELVCHV